MKADQYLSNSHKRDQLGYKLMPWHDKSSTPHCTNISGLQVDAISSHFYTKQTRKRG